MPSRPARVAESVRPLETVLRYGWHLRMVLVSLWMPWRANLRWLGVRGRSQVR